MKKLQVFICENFYPEYQNALERERIEDIELHVFPSLCDQKGRKTEVKEMLGIAHKNKSTVICSKSCDALKLLPEGQSVRTIAGNHCFSHLTCDEFLNYLTSKGSYIISSGWLKKWKHHLEVMGFDKETARRFFQESNKQLVFLDAEIEENTEELIKEFSSYVGVPYLIVPIELERIRLLLKSMAYEWRLHNQEQEHSIAVNELRNQCAEHAAVFDMLGKISTYATKRDVIGKIKELFLMVFGAQNFNFWSDQSDLLPNEIKELQTKEENYLLLREENRFCIKITWDGILYGVIDVSGFLFPQYIEKYLNLAVEISKFGGLVLHNNEQYEKILKSEEELKYLSTHDSMTGLYNRTYINRILDDSTKDSKICVFMFDIDKLKYVNDTYGHAEGDKLIKSFAEIMKNSFRETDISARIGGDEFMAILYDANEEMAQSIKKRVADLIRLNNGNLTAKHLELNVSAGCAIMENENDTIEVLMNKADEQMYADKAHKRKIV